MYSVCKLSPKDSFNEPSTTLDAYNFSVTDTKITLAYSFFYEHCVYCKLKVSVNEFFVYLELLFQPICFPTIEGLIGYSFAFFAENGNPCFVEMLHNNLMCIVYSNGYQNVAIFQFNRKFGICVIIYYKNYWSC